jgi:Family of unknown function (DUF5317)
MILVLPVVLAVAVGLVLGGRLESLATFRLRFPWLVVAAFGLQVVAFPFKWLPWTTPDAPATALWLVSFGLLALLAWSNRRLAGVPIVAAGLISNMVAVGVNGGSMPTLPAALAALDPGYVVANNSSFDASPKLAWLVDRWAVPSWSPVGNVFSVGDVVLAVGIVVVVVAAMGARLPRVRAEASLADDGAQHSV